MKIKAKCIKGVQFFRRAGLAFSSDVAEYEVTEDQLAIIEKEPMIEVITKKNENRK